MERSASSVLEDPRFRVPTVPSASAGVGWLRRHVVRFSDGADHQRRRQLVEAIIDRLGVVDDHGSPTRSLLAAMGLPPDLELDVAAVADAYQPHAPQSAAADTAADRLIAACGGRTEEAAASVCVVVQAHAATLALIEVLTHGSPAAPVPTTRRIDPRGTEVLVDLTDAHFGRGAHRCPGEGLAQQLARAALARADHR